MQRTKRIVDLLPETDIAFQKETFSRNRLLYNVTQIGVCVGGVRHSISRERYDAFALFYLREGAALLEYDGKTFRAEAGDLLFWNQKKPHTLRNAGNAPFTADFTYLFGPNADGFFAAFEQKHGCLLHGYDPALFSKAVAEITPAIRHDREDPYRTSALLYAVLADLLRYCDGDPDAESDVSKIVAYLSEHYAEPIRVSDISELVYLSKSYSIRKFCARTGFTPKEYLNNLRFDKSKVLLLESRDSVQEIAERVGFSDGRSLVSLFRRKLGMTPTQFRAISEKTRK